MNKDTQLHRVVNGKGTHVGYIYVPMAAVCHPLLYSLLVCKSYITGARDVIAPKHEGVKQLEG